MISILIPTYNYNIYPLVSELRKQAIQLSTPWELIVLDDASNLFDSENEQVSDFENIRYQKLNKNVGRSAVRAQLASLASYDHLLFLDADVMPETEQFLNNYLKHLSATSTILCGGIAYEDKKPNKAERLRYCYGIKREVKKASQRALNPHIVVSGNIIVRKDVYKAINTELAKFYGSDLVISENIKRQKIEVLHIDNPVIHLGLETSEVFLEKSINLQDTLVKLEQESVISDTLTGIQRAFLRLKKYGGIIPFKVIFPVFKPLIIRQLLSRSPSLFLFDLLKLFHFIKSKKNA